MELIRSAAGYLRKDELTKNGTIMFMSGTVAAIFSYIYQVYIGRVLGPEEYGIFGALFAIFYIIGIISQTLGTSATQFVSKLKGEGKQIGLFIKGSSKRMVLIGSLLSLSFLVFRKELMSELGLSDIMPVLILIMILSLSWISPILEGSLRGMKRFYALGFAGISNTAFKMISGIALVMAGFGVSGALFGVAAGMIVGLIISFIFLKPHLSTNKSREPDPGFSSFYSYSLPVLAAMISISIPSNLDVILAKFFFSPVEAGLYTSVSVLGKIIFFFSGAVGMVMFPMITERYARGEDTRGILKKSIIYVATLSGGLALIYILFPQIVVWIFGEKYVDAVDLVAPYGMAMFFVALTSILMNYYLAIKNMKYIVFFAGFTVIEVALLLICSSSMAYMVYALLTANFVFMAMSMIYTFKNELGIKYKTKYITDVKDKFVDVWEVIG